MKNKSLFISSLAILSLFAACADDAIVDFRTEKPASIAQYEYLNVYDALKTYVDRSANPNFKLGIALGANDFIAGTQVRSLAVSNFDEMTAGNEMKYASCVSDDGSMNFSTVSNFVTAAQAAGMTIYGHTLAWHSQQNNKYLNSLIANKVIPVDPSTANHYLLLHQDTKANPWDGQVYYTLSENLSKGTEYTLSFKAKASATFNFQFWIMRQSGSDVTVNGGTAIAPNWTDYSFTFTPADDDWNTIKFVAGELAGDFCLDDLKLVATDSDVNLIQNGDFEKDDLTKWTKYSWHAITYVIQADSNGGSSNYWETLVSNGDAEGSDVSCFYSTEPSTGGPKGVTIGESGTGADGSGHAFIVKSENNPVNTWDTQFFIRANTVLKAGDVCKLSMKYKADKPAGSESQAHAEPGAYIHYDMGVSLNFTTDWQTYEKEFTISESQAGTSGMQTIAWNLAVLGEANTYYFDDIDFSIQRQAEGLPQTPEEKKDTLTWAMDNWIKGMMEATGGYVTSWDAVNEAVSGVDADGDGYYDLQSASNGDPENNFYWQDYLGDEDYARIVVAKAREHFAAYGGNPSDLKLFINDYNLESWWDGNKKAKSLVHWIETWESDGVTKIDGIGTQMHVSYILNEADQKAQEDAIVNMFQILAASGKLIKISELDMGIVEKAFGTGIKTELVTFEQQQKMAEFYKFIISKYFEIIPVAQQYGITQWCATDSPADSGWRGGEPVGLWDINYNRKPAYAGFVEGLQSGSAN